MIEFRRRYPPALEKARAGMYEMLAAIDRAYVVDMMAARSSFEQASARQLAEDMRIPIWKVLVEIEIHSMMELVMEKSGYIKFIEDPHAPIA